MVAFSVFLQIRYDCTVTLTVSALSFVLRCNRLPT